MISSPFPKSCLAALALAATLALAAPALAQAQVSVADAWARAVVPGQNATGAFMRLTAASDATLVDVTSPAAQIVEIHEMRMEGGVMRMSAVERVSLPAGKPVELKPSGYHVMLMDLKVPFKAGDVVPLTLTIEDRSGKKQKVEVKAKVRPFTER
jgi:copper(I)-binding protein